MKAILQESLPIDTVQKYVRTFTKPPEAESLCSSASSVASQCEKIGEKVDFYSISSTTTNMVLCDHKLPNKSRHIHFKNEVSQCIAVGEIDEEEKEFDRHWPFENDESSDNEVLMMKPLPTRKLVPIRRRLSKIIAPLPPTMLKDENATEPILNPSRIDVWWPKDLTLTPIASPESLPLSRHIDSIGEDDRDNIDLSGPSEQTGHGSSGDGECVDNPKEDIETSAALPLCSSSSHILDDDDECASSKFGFFSKVVDTANTVRDIVYVLLNVGW
jgi:hypothetical protein